MIIFFMIMTSFAEDRAEVYKKKIEIDFEALDVTGELVKPQGAILQERGRAKFNPLIKIRYDFNDEISDSVRDIR